MKKKNQWKKSIALGMFLGATTIGSTSLAAAGYITYDDGQIHQEDSDFTGMPGEYISVEILNGTSLDGKISIQDQDMQLLLNGSSVNGSMDIGATGSYGYASVGLTIENNSTWSGDINIQTEPNSVASLGGNLTNSNFSGDISGNNARVTMDLDQSEWIGDLDLVTNDGNNGLQSSAQIHLENNSKWEGNLSFANSGEININIDHSEWVGSFEKTITDNSYAHIGSHFVTLYEGKWDGDYILRNEVAEITPGYNNIIIGGNSEWNGNFVGANAFDNMDALGNYVNIGDASVWNGNAEISGNSIFFGNIYDSHWTGNLIMTDVKVDETYGGQAGTITLYGNTVWTGAVQTNTENTVDVFFADHATWQVTGDSKIKMLNLNGTSKIEFVNSPTLQTDSYSTLTVLDEMNAEEGAQIDLRTNLAQNTGDLLDFRGNVVGKILIGINNQGSASVDPSRELTIIKTVASEDDTFSLTHEVEVGGFKYLMKKEGTNWVLYSLDRLPGMDSSLTSSASGAINTLSAGYLLNYAENENVLKRTGELREGTADRNIWGRIYGGEFGSNATGYVGAYDMNYHGVQIGADKKIILKNGKGDLYLGGMLGYSKGNLDYKNGSGSIDSKHLGIYGTYVAPSDFYGSLVLKYGWTDSDFTVRDSAGDSVNGKGLKSDGFAGSLELGKKIHFNKEAKSGWYMEPQAQFTYGMQNGGSVTASNGLKVDLDGYQSLQGRLGMRAGYEVKSGKNPINIYGKLSYVHEFDGKMDVALNGIDIQEDLGDSWWNYGVGVTAKVGNHHNLYLEFEKSSGDRFNQKWGISGGYRINW